MQRKNDVSKSVLLTRSESDNELLKKRLKSYDFDLLECSLIKHTLIDFDYSLLDQYSDIIITSNVAASALPSAVTKKNFIIKKRAWVVGETSRKTLESKGYDVIFCAPNAISLRNALEDTDKKVRFAYLSGNYITLEMPEYVQRFVTYNTTYRFSLSEKQIKRYRQEIDYILLYSENSARALLRLFIENDLIKYLENTTIIAISEKVGLVLSDYFVNIEYAKGADDMIVFLEKINERQKRK